MIRSEKCINIFLLHSSQYKLDQMHANSRKQLLLQVCTTTMIDETQTETYAQGQNYNLSKISTALHPEEIWNHRFSFWFAGGQKAVSFDHLYISCCPQQCFLPTVNFFNHATIKLQQKKKHLIISLIKPCYISNLKQVVILYTHKVTYLSTS